MFQTERGKLSDQEELYPYSTWLSYLRNMIFKSELSLQMQPESVNDNQGLWTLTVENIVYYVIKSPSRSNWTC